MRTDRALNPLENDFFDELELEENCSYTLVFHGLAVDRMEQVINKVLSHNNYEVFMKNMATEEMKSLILEHNLKELIKQDAGVAKGLEFEFIKRWGKLYEKSEPC